MSGTTRSMPNISSSGNIRPQSITTISSPYSNTYMFLPISPTPPSGMMRRIGWAAGIRAECPVPASEDRQLVGGRGPRIGGDGDERRRVGLGHDLWEPGRGLHRGLA